MLPPIPSKSRRERRTAPLPVLISSPSDGYSWESPLDGMKERGLAPRDSRRDARGAHVERRRRPHMCAEYDGRQVVGIDLHRRRSVIVRMDEAGHRLDTV